MVERCQRLMNKVNKNFDGLTKNQTLILNSLKQARQPLGAYTLLENLQSKGIKAPLQVYRALAQLADKGLVHKIESLNSWTLCCVTKHVESPIFAICKDCGEVREHLDEKIFKRLSNIQINDGFRPDHAVLEIYGKCSNCV